MSPHLLSSPIPLRTKWRTPSRQRPPSAGTSIGARTSVSAWISVSVWALTAACSGDGGTGDGVTTGTDVMPGVSVMPGNSGGPAQPGASGPTSGPNGTPAPSDTGAVQPTSPGNTEVPPTTPIDVENADCSVPKAPSALMRRLTSFEYRNAVFDLFGIEPTTDIPLDGVTDGYDNNTSVLNVSSLHAEKFVLASEEIAKAAVQNLSTLAPCPATDEAGEAACAAEFAKSFGRRVFRRDITPEDETALMAAYAIGRDGGSHAEGIEVMLRAMLRSPHFLYRVERAQSTALTGSQVASVSPYEMASRLSFLIWASVPDEAVLDAAKNGELTTKEQVAARARTMLADDKAKRGIVNFYEQWLGTGKIGITQKNQDLFPLYTSAVQSAMAAELPAFVNHVLWEGDRKLSSMFTSSVAFVNSDLAAVYGISGIRSETLTMAEVPAEHERAGVLTQAGFLSVQAHPDQTSPVLRGKFVRTKLMCQPPPPPPPDADITPPDAAASATARERFSAHNEAGTSCAGCHQLMDPIGFAFEHFDAVGQHRLQENGVNIDVSGEISGGTDSLAGAFTGVRELGAKLADSSVVQNCVATQWFRFAAGRNEAPGDECSLSTLQSQFAESGGDLIELVVAMTQTDAFLYRPVTEVTP